MHGQVFVMYFQTFSRYYEAFSCLITSQNNVLVVLSQFLWDYGTKFESVNYDFRHRSLKRVRLFDVFDRNTSFFLHNDVGKCSRFYMSVVI